MIIKIKTKERIIVILIAGIILFNLLNIIYLRLLINRLNEVENTIQVYLQDNHEDYKIVNEFIEDMNIEIREKFETLKSEDN